jgi:ubiquinone/menaquinone biosynthesis C-methylase UbiE
MFQKSAAFYDAIYSFKNYEEEASKVHTLIQKFKRSARTDLLDVACGTGKHLSYLRQNYRCEGLDVEPAMVAIAYERHTDITFHQADMRDFELGRQFDVITCLFSSIGYVRTIANLNRAIANMTRHLVQGGVLVVEPWFSREEFGKGRASVVTVDEPDLKVARVSRSLVEGDISILEFHYLVGTADGIDYFTERDELGLFSKKAYEEAFLAAGLSLALYDDQGLMGRGLYVALKT